MNKAVIIALFVVMVLVSGCAEKQVKTDKNNGLLIDSLVADPSAIEDTDDVLFSMDVENVGGTTASDIAVNFYGAEAWDGKKSYNLSDMDPPDPLINMPGDFKTVTTLLTPPDLPEGVVANFPITARVIYKYKTTGTINIPAYSKTLYRINREKGTVDSTVLVDNTFAPIQVALSKGAVPLVIDEEEGEETNYILEFVNVGDGWPVTESATGKMKGTIKLVGLGAELEECLGIGASDNEVDFDDVDVFRLRSNGRVPVSCSLTIEPDDWEATTSGSMLFIIDIYYDYYIEDIVNVRVYGTE